MKQYSDDRKALALEIMETLKKRGHWVPKDFEGSDIIMAVGKALDSVNLQNEELQNKLRKAQHTPKPSDYDELRSQLDHANRLSGEYRNALERIAQCEDDEYAAIALTALGLMCEHHSVERCKECATAEKRKQVCGFWEAGRPCTNDEPCPKHGTMPENRI